MTLEDEVALLRAENLALRQQVAGLLEQLAAMERRLARLEQTQIRLPSFLRTNIPRRERPPLTTGFDKLTKRAKQALSLAQEEARNFNHPYVGTEHILLGLIRDQEGVAGKVLDDLGVKLQQARSAVEFIVGRGEGFQHTGEAELTERSKRVIEYAIEEARKLNHHYIGTEHLLLGLTRNGEGVATRVLEIMGVSLEQVRTYVQRLLHGLLHEGESSSL